MPPRIKITKEKIIASAVELVRRCGAEALNARSVAKEIGSSTQPVFTNFSSMDDLKSSVIAAAYGIYLGFIEREVESGKYPRYKAFGMAYIRFAREEKELFRLLFMRDRTGEDLSSSPDFDASVEMIVAMMGVDTETAKLIHLEMWSAVHGIATMLATSFLTLDTELISKMISDVYTGVQKNHTDRG